MKIRNGYVSNSSSSSYVIRYTDDVIENGDISFSFVDFIRMIERYGSYSSDDTEIEALGNESVISYLNSGYDKDLVSLIDKKDDNHAIISISYHDDMIRKFLKFFINHNIITILNESNN